MLMLLEVNIVVLLSNEYHLLIAKHAIVAVGVMDGRVGEAI